MRSDAEGQWRGNINVYPMLSLLATEIRIYVGGPILVLEWVPVLPSLHLIVILYAVVILESPVFGGVFFVNFFSLAFASLKTPASVRGFGYPPAPEDLVSSLILYGSGQVDRRYLENQWGCQRWGAIKPPSTCHGFGLVHTGEKN